MSKYADNDHYVHSASGVLLNRLDITDKAELEQVESDFAALRSAELAADPITDKISTAVLQEVHRRLFGDVYAWAGEFRDVDISKGSTRFANWRQIIPCLDTLFSELQAENELLNTAPADFSQRAAYYMGELNAIHPFREGNGRTQREVLSQLAYRTGYIIKWRDMTAEDILQATILSFAAKREPLAQLILNNLEAE